MDHTVLALHESSPISPDFIERIEYYSTPLSSTTTLHQNHFEQESSSERPLKPIPLDLGMECTNEPNQIEKLWTDIDLISTNEIHNNENVESLQEQQEEKNLGDANEIKRKNKKSSKKKSRTIPQEQTHSSINLITESQLPTTSSSNISTVEKPVLESPSKLKRTSPKKNKEHLLTVIDWNPLIKGNEFMKYGRRGKPHKKTIWMNENHTSILWKTDGKKKSKSIQVSDIQEIVEGCSTRVFQRYSKQWKYISMNCFSIKTKKRTLDLHTTNLELKKDWVILLQQLLYSRK